MFRKVNTNAPTMAMTAQAIVISTSVKAPFDFVVRFISPATAG
jgi:hypothetical protein